jgi:hypothetical protein
LLKVGGTKAYDNFGAFDRLQPELARFLMECGNDTAHAEAAAGLIAGFVAASLHAYSTSIFYVASA